MSQPHNQPQAEPPAHTMPQDQPRQKEPARLGIAGRLAGVLISPGETFADINRKPTWIAPLVIIIISVIGYGLFFEWRAKPDWDSIFRAQVRKQLAKSGQTLTPEQMDQQVAVMTKMSKTDFTSPLSMLLTLAFGVGYCLFVYVIPAGVFALGMMFMQAQTTYKKILSVLAWSGAATGLISLLVRIASLMVRDRESLNNINPIDPAGIVPSNPAVILPAGASASLKTLAAAFDVFTIWYLILLVIGFAIIAGSRKITTGKMAVLVFGVWAVYLIIRVGWSAAFGV
jgi:hypothetical protein